MSQGQRNVADRSTMGGRLQQARIDMGLSVRKLSQLTDIRRGTIGCIESGASDGHISTLLKLARELDISLYYLFGDRAGYGSYGE